MRLKPRHDTLDVGLAGWAQGYIIFGLFNYFLFGERQIDKVT